MKDYNLDFYQALKIVMEGGCVKGKYFANGIYLRLNSTGFLVSVNANKYYTEEFFTLHNGLLNQKFRELTVMTMKELLN
jgi:hypothetical protein